MRRLIWASAGRTYGWESHALAQLLKVDDPEKSVYWVRGKRAFNEFILELKTVGFQSLQILYFQRIGVLE